VVPAAGLRPDGLRWCRPPSSEFFLPQKLLAARFRNRLKIALQQMPDSDTIPASAWHQAWVVNVQPAGSGQSAIKYLAAYVYHTALGSQRILSAHNNQITFKYKDSADQQWHVLQLCVTEFLRRFLQHVLPKGFQRVRYFGWLSPAAKTRWQRILALLDWKAPLAQVPLATPAPPCLCCHKPMILVGHFARPPPSFRFKR
jgi:hypothetical protein